MGDPYNMFAGCSSVKSIKEYFRKILTMVDYEEEKDNLILKKKLDRIVEMCKEKEDRLKKNLEIISVEGKKAYSKCLEITVAIGNAFPSSLLKWSETLKGAKIKITGNIAEQTSMEASGQRFGLIEPSLSQSN